MTVDRNRLIKLLNMTESAHDGESLNAIRASNALMRQSNTTWAELIAASTVSKPEFEAPKADKPEPAYEEAQPRSDNWGRDLFGDQPSMHSTRQTANAEAEEKGRTKDALRAKIAGVPLWLRVAFFPIWAFASSYAIAVHAEPWPTKALAVLVPLAVGAFTGSFWMLILMGIAQALGFDGSMRFM